MVEKKVSGEIRSFTLNGTNGAKRDREECGKSAKETQ